jgi:hypothetical protein
MCSSSSISAMVFLASILHRTSATASPIWAGYKSLLAGELLEVSDRCLYCTLPLCGHCPNTGRKAIFATCAAAPNRLFICS